MKRLAVLLVVIVAAQLAVGVSSSAVEGTRYLDRVFESVDVTRDIEYRRAIPSLGDGPGLLDFYEPAGDTATARPLLIWLHGVGLASSDKADSIDVLISQTFAQHGAVVASINYRWYDTGRAARDARTAIAFFRANAATYRIDTTRVILAGMSAGAITSTNASYLPDITASEPPADQRAQAVMSLAGFGPLDAAQAGEPPVFMAHGIHDINAPYDRAVEFCADANAADVPCEFHSFDADHIGLLSHAAELEVLMSTWLYDTLDLANAQDPPREPTETTTTATTTSTTAPPVDEAPPADPVAEQPNLAG